MPIGDLPAGKSTDFSLRIPRSELPIPNQRGVYWVGVHALGTNKLGRDGVADGRARTFAPLYRATSRKTDVTLVVPFRAQVRRDSTGALRRAEPLEAAAQSDEGRLERILGMVESAGSSPVTLVIDPTVLDAVETAWPGCPNDPDRRRHAGPATPSPTAQPRAPTQGPRTAPVTAATPTRRRRPHRARAQAWLDRLGTVAATKSVLGVGYGDPDVAGTRAPLRRPADHVVRAGAGDLRGLPGRRPGGRRTALGFLPDSVLHGWTARPGCCSPTTATPPRRTDWRSAAGQQILFGDSGAASGGPGPSATQTALALRQRIVSDAALRAMSGSRPPRWSSCSRRAGTPVRTGSPPASSRRWTSRGSGSSGLPAPSTSDADCATSSPIPARQRRPRSATRW